MSSYLPRDDHARSHGRQPAIRSVLVFGAADGGVARELCKYHTIEKIDIVEIDRRLVEVSKEVHAAHRKASFSDPRVKLHYSGRVEVHPPQCREQYDLVIVDSNDPSGPGEVLFTKEFYGGCHSALDGKRHPRQPARRPVLSGGSDAFTAGARALRQRVSGQQGVSGAHSHLPHRPLAVRVRIQQPAPREAICTPIAWNALIHPNPILQHDLHTGAFALPNYVEEVLEKMNKNIHTVSRL